MLGPGDTVVGPTRRYRIEAVQGTGASAATYRARDLGTDRIVIVKAIALRGLPEWKVLELFEREAAALKRIEHPRIPRYEDSFILDGDRVVARPEDVRDQPTFVLVQEYVAGQSLAARLRDRGPLSAPEAARLFHSLLGIVEYLHGLQPPIVHRDIKPSNIILDETDEPHLVDFGAVRDRLHAEHSVGSTTAGTFGYMPLEQQMGVARPASDLYALAMTVMVATTGLEPGSLPVDERTGKVRVSTTALPSLMRAALDRMLEPIVGRRAASVADVQGVLHGAGRLRPRFVAMAGAISAAGMLAWLASTGVTNQDVMPAQLILPVSAPSTGWFDRVRPHCNAIEAEVTLKRNPAPATPRDQAHAAACYALAGKVALAESTLDALPAAVRGGAANTVFAIIHPVADQGDDQATGPIMRLVLKYTPDNFMALYHAGMAEYLTGDVESARTHLTRFLELYRANDGWVHSAKRVLAEIEAPSEGACDGPIVVDPEGRAVHAPGCPRR